MCVRVKEDCGTLDDSNVYYAPGSDELMSVKMFCPCYETYTGYCYKGHGQGGYCATSAEVCTDGHTYVDAKTAKTYDMDACMLCLEDDANDGPLPIPAYAVSTPAPSPKPTLGTAAAPALSKMGACASVAPGEDLTAAGVKYRCEPSADHCGQTFADSYTGPETGTEANFHTHEMLETAGISCEVRRSLLDVIVAVDDPRRP